MNLPSDPMLDEIPVPQADDLDKVFGVVDAVAAGHRTALDVADELEMVGRQGFYYVAAAEQLGLVERNEHELSLTPVGEQYTKVDDARKHNLRRQIVMESPFFRHAAACLEIERPVFKQHAHLFTDMKFVADTIEELGFAEPTALRRAATVKAWMKSLGG